jgi:hypothetical protein
METEKSIQEILDRLLASQERAEARLEKFDADAKTRHEEAEARQEKVYAEMEARAVAHQEKISEMEAMAEAREEKAEARAEARHERFLAFLDGLTFYGEGTTTCQTETTSSSEVMQATNLEATPEEIEAPVKRQDLVKEEINAENIGSSEDRSGYQRLALRRRRGAKNWTQDSVGSRQKVSAARKRVIRRAIPAVRKGNIRKGPGKNNAAKGASRGKMLVKRQHNSWECEDGRLDRDLKKRLSLRMRRTSGRNFKKPIQLEKKKRIFGSTNGLRKANKWTFWKVLNFL